MSMYTNKFQVRERLEEFAHDFSLHENALLSTEAINVEKLDETTFLVDAISLTENTMKTVKSNFLCITVGILQHEPFSLEDRGIHGGDRFTGEVSFASRHCGRDSIVGSKYLHGKKVVILGSGSFAAEALETAARQGCDDIVVIGRPRRRWIIPFSRQYTITSLIRAPIVPWSLKANLVFVRLRCMK